MREIKFRGKRMHGINPNEWAYGEVVTIREDSEIKVSLIIPDLKYISGNDGFYEVGYEVYPETIGQYTGLKDKNGKEIYEGDIVMESDYSNGGAVNFPQPRTQKVVQFREDGCIGFLVGFNIKTIKDKGEVNIEVVGNIHEPK